MVRQAKTKDIDSIFRLIELHASNGQMLGRSLEEIVCHISDFIVYEFEGRVAGACSLKYGWDQLVEIRSLAVHPDFYRRGFASAIVTECIESAMEKGGVEGVFVLTYAIQLFEKLGFQRIRKGSLPLKVWEDCMACSKKNSCDEIAMFMTLQSAAHGMLGERLMDSSMC
ncbi:MAG: GNAT family N-acetyltransferase [Acidiferrobacteraceae bacterium]|nr:GNAT family N-acetyltransferase [Acidiferrobacteraceae bacterium]|tara:strand:+ start:724 stop:1230 length:507 start_codon:yes stop_codon:yes gene_type:complete